jgi:hypothetical protein
VQEVVGSNPAVPTEYGHAKAYYTKDGSSTGEHITFRSALRPLLANFDQLPAHEFGPKKLKASMIFAGFGSGLGAWWCQCPAGELVVVP